MKRIISLLLTILTVLFAGTSCAGTQPPQDDGKLTIVTTIFPAYDFARAIGGEHVNLTLLLPPGAESHSFEPTPQDIIKIQNSDIFIYNGGDSDTWVKEILLSIDTSKTTVLSMMDMVTVVPEEIVEGMEEDHGHEHEEINPEDIQARPLSDWQGEWKTVETALENGALEEYVADLATENATTPPEQKKALAAGWESIYPHFTIDGNVLKIGEIEISYTYVGYKLVEGEHGDTVWYGYSTTPNSTALPTFIAFADHRIAPHTPEEGEIQHFHMRYGNESFEALATMENWAPTYFAATATDVQIAQTMSEHLHAEEAEHEENREEAHEDEEYDEHVWTSPLNAATITKAIAQTMRELDSSNAATYAANMEAYVAELQEVDTLFREVVAGATRKTLVFGDRFPLRYFADEYGLNYYAAFPGCSTETEPSAQTVAFLINKVQEENIPVVLHLELSNQKMADTICESTGAQKRMFHAAHNVTKTDLESGRTYVDIMRSNVDILKEALN